MNKNQSSTSSSSDDEAVITPKQAPDENAEEKLDDSTDPGTADTSDGSDAIPASSNNLVLNAAVTALEQLTDTVERLGTLVEEDGRPQIIEFTNELRTLADYLADAISLSPSPAVELERETSSYLGVLVASVRTTLQQLGESIAANKAATVRSKPAKPKSVSSDSGDHADSVGEDVTSESQAKPKPKLKPNAKCAIDTTTDNQGFGSPGISTATESDHNHQVHTELATLSASVQKLLNTLRDQAQRLTKLEKGIGLPNSTPLRETTAKTNTNDEDIGWPMDLNRPFDRNHVDSSISFHDL